MSIIIGLIILGLVFISFELIVPGGILGFLGGIAILAACVLAYMDYGMLGAMGILLTSIILVTITLIIELKFLPKTKIGSQMFLKKSVDDQSTHTLGSDSIIGKEGTTQTTLAPTGMIIVDGQSFEAFSRDGLIEKGAPVKVIDRDNFRIVVEKLT